MIKLHHIVLVKKEKLLAIDFTPMNQSNTKTLLKLLVGKNVPAEIRIRSISNWSLSEWSVSNGNSLLNTTEILNEICKINETQWTYMNLYNHNCQHFSKELINNLYLT